MISTCACDGSLADSLLRMTPFSMSASMVVYMVISFELTAAELQSVAYTRLCWCYCQHGVVIRLAVSSWRLAVCKALLLVGCVGERRGVHAEAQRRKGEYLTTEVTETRRIGEKGDPPSPRLRGTGG